MGLLDSIIGSLLGGAGNQSSGMGSVLSDILGGRGGTGTPDAGHPGSGNSVGVGAGGGLGGLIAMAEQAGLGNVVQSWIGTGPNRPISPDDLQNIFGDKVPDMAQKAGMDQGDFLSQLSRHLPNAVDRATPNGQVPNESSVDV